MKFDAKILIASQSSPSLAYVAFYSDIEHEVLKVTSGRRVTVTYNLYLVDLSSEHKRPAATAIPRNALNLQNTLRELLKSSEFLPRGGTLGFGLAHLYPVTPNMELPEIISCLKGEDAHVHQACRELRLWPELQMIYDDDRSGSESRGIMLDRIAMGPSYNWEHSSYEGTLVGELGGISVNKTECAGLDGSSWVYEDHEKREYITWVSPFNQRNQLYDISIAYGNDVTTGYIYCSPCIIVPIDAACDRVM